MSLLSFCLLFPNHSVYKRSPPFVLFDLLAVQKRKLKALICLPVHHFVVKFNKSPNMNDLFPCIITSENNNKQYLVSYSYKHVAFLRVSFIKELARSVIVYTFFNQTGNTVDETMQWQYLNQYINIYLHRECSKTSCIPHFIATTKNLLFMVTDREIIFLCSAVYLICRKNLKLIRHVSKKNFRCTLFTLLSTRMIKILQHKKLQYNYSKQLKINQFLKYKINKCKSAVKMIKEKR